MPLPLAENPLIITMKLHPSTYAILHFTPWARLRKPRDRFYPLFFIALAVLAVDVGCLLRLESLYREDARSRNSLPLRQDARQSHRIDREGAPGGGGGVPYGAEVRGVKNGQPVIQF